MKTNLLEKTKSYSLVLKKWHKTGDPWVNLPDLPPKKADFWIYCKKFLKQC